MLRLKEIPHRLRQFFNQNRNEAIMDREMKFHLEMSIQEKMQNGVSENEARKQALSEFGSIERYKEDCRDSWGTRLINDFFRDVRYGWRQFKKNQTHSITVILTVGICVGVLASVFNIFNTLYINPGLYPNEHRIVRIADVYENDDYLRNNKHTNPSFYLDRKEQSELIEKIGYTSVGMGTITSTEGSAQPDFVRYAWISPSLLSVIQPSIILGRSLNNDDGIRGNHHVALINHSHWLSRYNGREDVIGKQFEINNRVVTIIGVTAKDLKLPRAFNSLSWKNVEIPFFVPMPLDASNQNQRGMAHNYGASFALLKNGVSISQIRSELEAIQLRTSVDYPNIYKNDQENGHRIVVDSIRDDLIRNTKNELIFLFATALSILGLGTINITSLLISRNQQRLQEFKTRSSIGASPNRLYQQVMSESIIYSSSGALIGLMFVGVFYSILKQLGLLELFLIPPNLRFDFTLIGFVFLASVIVGVFTNFISLITTRKSSRAAAIDVAGTRTASAGKKFKRNQRLLIGGQILLTFTVLGFAGMMLKSIIHIQKIDTGFSSEDVFTISFDLRNTRYDDESKRIFMSNITKNIESIPGVSNVGIAWLPPLKFANLAVEKISDERDYLAGSQRTIEAFVDVIDDSALEIVEAKIVKGRNFDLHDFQYERPVTLIDEPTASELFGTEDPIGKRVALNVTPSREANSNPPEWLEIIGVVSYIRRDNLIHPKGFGTLYRHYYNQIPPFATVLVKSQLPTVDLLKSIRDEFQKLDPKVAVFRKEWMDTILIRNYRTQRNLLFMISSVGGIALILSSLGLFGVIRYIISLQQKEVGIRIALGESILRARDTVVIYWVKTATISIACAMISTLIISHRFRNFLYEVDPKDPTVLGLTALFILTIVYATTVLSTKSIKSLKFLQVLRTE